MPRNLVLFDLEWNIGYKPYLFNYHGVQQTFRGEIIEIGAVKIDEDANVLDTFSIHLRPRIFRTLQHHIAKVTGLTQADLDRGEPIVQGLRRFMQWCGPDAEFAEWGMDDVPVLKQNLFLCNLDESRPTQWYDLQQIFLREHPRKEGEGMTLESVVTRMGIPMERPFTMPCPIPFTPPMSAASLTCGRAWRLPHRGRIPAGEPLPRPRRLPGLPGVPRLCGAVCLAQRLKGHHCQLPGVRRGSAAGRYLAEKGQQRLVYSVCLPCLRGTGNEVGKGVFQRYKLARRDGLHWSFARCVQIPDEAGLARWERMRAQQIERMQARAEKAAAEAAGKA